MPASTKALDVVDVSQHTSANFIQQIKDINTAQSATVILVPPNWAFRITLTELALKKGGCRFSTNDRSNIISLLNLLNQMDIKKAMHVASSWEPEPREGIYLTLANGSEVKFLFGQRFADHDTVRGIFSDSSANPAQYITAHESFPQKLLEWAAATGKPFSKDITDQNSCEEFVKNAIKNN